MKNIITKSKSFILIRIIFITILLLHSIQNTFAQNVINVFHSGGTGDDYGKEIAYKDDGRYYLTGNFNSTANIFGETLSSQNPNFDDIFISCFDTSGQNIFTKSIGSMKDDIARGIAIDSTGRTYVTGTFNDSLQFADTTIYNPCGNSPNSGKGIFLIKYSPQGNRLWEKVVCGTKTTANSKVLLDPFGKVWLIGNYENGGVLIDTLNLSGSGNTNIFIARFTKNGNLEFANGISASGSGPSQCLLTGITVNNQGAVFISGYYKYANHINGFSVPDGSYYKPFIMKMDYSGNIQWVSGSSSNNNCYSKGFINDISGNSYITGYFQGTTTFGSQTIASNGGYDYFIACCSSSGQWQWAESVGNTGNDYAFGISLNSQNELFITGRFENSLSFAGQNLISNGGTDIFLAKYDLAGGFLAAQSYGGSADDGAYNVYITENDTIIITGYFQNTMTIDTITTTSNGGKDIFVASFLDTIACNVPNSYINIINNYTEISLSTSFQYDTSQYFLTWQMGDGTEFYQTTSIVYDYQAIDTFYISLHIVDKNDSLCFKDFYETVITMCILDELQISKQINNTSVSLETSYSLDTSQYSITWNMGDGTEFYQTTSVEYDYQAIDTFNTILYIEYNNDSLCFINLFETVITNCFLDNLDFSMQMNNNNVVFETSYFIDTNQFQIVWDVGDSTSITNLNNPVHYYNSYGYKSITLSATYLPDSTCNIQIQKILNIDNLPCITTPEIVIHENIDKHAIFELIPNVDTINYQILWDLEYGTIVYDQNLIDHIFPYNYITYLTCQISHIADSNCVITVEKEIDLDCYDEIGFDYWETTDEWPGGWEYHVWADIVYD
ncbi:MAG: hypothetical protein HOG05_09025, partial [Bacteroidetes bacterium]|nr:hypothetical protein [Bacteroidota bacterium]